MIGGLILGGYLAYQSATVQTDIDKEFAKHTPAQGPFRPRPRPPEPPPAPLTEDDSKLFQRLRLHIERSADERAARKIEDAFDEAIRKMDSFNPDIQPVVNDEPSQFVFTSLFASAILTLVWKVVKMILLAILVGVIGGLIYTYWVWLAGGFVVATSIVCWPISFAAAKLANDGMTEQEVEALVQLRIKEAK